jgi:hypothetical protein
VGELCSIPIFGSNLKNSSNELGVTSFMLPIFHDNMDFGKSAIGPTTNTPLFNLNPS